MRLQLDKRPLGVQPALSPLPGAPRPLLPPHLRMPTRRPLATVGLVLLEGILYSWEARAQQLPVPNYAFFGHDFKRDGLSGTLGRLVP